MRRFPWVLAISLLFTLPAFAQECTDQFIRANINSNDRNLLTSDTYFFSGALDKPIVGIDNADSKKVDEKLSHERKNAKYDPLKVERVVVAPSGDMAYVYGSGHGSFDEVATGKHIDFTPAFLMVWRADSGTCKIAAAIYEPQCEK
jgi:hypothetical protein